MNVQPFWHSLCALAMPLLFDCHPLHRRWFGAECRVEFGVGVPSSRDVQLPQDVNKLDLLDYQQLEDDEIELQKDTDIMLKPSTLELEVLEAEEFGHLWAQNNSDHKISTRWLIVRLIAVSFQDCSTSTVTTKADDEMPRILGRLTPRSKTSKLNSNSFRRCATRSINKLNLKLLTHLKTGKQSGKILDILKIQISLRTFCPF